MQQAAKDFYNGSFSDWTEVITGVPHGSILGPFLFNIFLNDIFMFNLKCNLCNYVDDNTLYSNEKDLNRIRRNLEMKFMILHQWFHENHMTLSSGKCHYMVIGSSELSHEIMLNDNRITSSNEEKLLGIFLDSKLRLSLQKSRPKNKCLSQVKELPYIRSKKFTT